MTPQEAMERGAKCRAAVLRAQEQHQLALQAFSVACARFDWPLAAHEHQLAVDHLDAYLIAMMACHRLGQEMIKR